MVVAQLQRSKQAQVLNPLHRNSCHLEPWSIELLILPGINHQFLEKNQRAIEESNLLFYSLSTRY
jgi:hypothetical protein